MAIEGANVNFDADGNFVNIMDTGWIEAMVISAAQRQGIDKPRYFKPRGAVGLAFEQAAVHPSQVQ
jgi:hypothetical protein